MSKLKWCSLFIVVGSFALIATNLKLVDPFPPAQEHRQTSIYHGDGRCSWTPPEYDPPANLTYHKTLIAGFPGGEKRLTFALMEALTGLSTRDEWDFEYFGDSNNPFIKANYPHYAGTWAWENKADQVILAVRNIRKSMVDFHDICYELDYPTNYIEASVHSPRIYTMEDSTSDEFLAWRDEVVMQEISYYGWYIDYWMEGGLKRDVYTHNITTDEHWDMLLQNMDKEDVEYGRIVGEAPTRMSYDSHCDLITDGCVPVTVVSADRLCEEDTGHLENRKIAQVLLSKEGYEEMIPQDGWNCIWNEMLVKKKGMRTFVDREHGRPKDLYNFSEHYLEAMLYELDRLINKYEVLTGELNESLVDILKDDRQVIQEELDEVLTGRRKMKVNDFLGPKARAKRKQEIEDEKLYWSGTEKDELYKENNNNEGYW